MKDRKAPGHLIRGAGLAPARRVSMIIQPIDRDELRRRVQEATPFPNVCIDNFLEPAFAERVLASFPTYQDSVKVGKSFDAVNERYKVQVTDASTFPQPIAELNAALAAPEFLDLLSHAFDMPGLLADDELSGGGIHQTGPRGHLDVHVDFNIHKTKGWYRRLNILVYLNKNWKDEWGGKIELWDKDVQKCHHAFLPIFNRCVIFETNEISYHGVTAVTCPPDMSRKSFAAYYYTEKAPAWWDGTVHSTIFKARPNEVLKGNVLMPAEKATRWLKRRLSGLKHRVIGKS
jgi:hypothetical protein